MVSLDFLRAKENIVFLGPLGVGKSHLSIALGYEAVRAGYQVKLYSFSDLVDELHEAKGDETVSRRIRQILKNDLVILDEMGCVSMNGTVSDQVFQLISKAYETRSLIITSNLEFAEWGELFESVSVATAVLDRLLHHAHVFPLRGDSYRVRGRITPPTRTGLS